MQWMHMFIVTRVTRMSKDSSCFVKISIVGVVEQFIFNEDENISSMFNSFGELETFYRNTINSNIFVTE